MVKLRFSDTGAWKTKNGIIGWRNPVKPMSNFYNLVELGLIHKTRQDIITPRLVSN
jgi:hypothetical protein